MWLLPQLLCTVWIASTWSLFCFGTPLNPGQKSTDVSLAGTSIHSPTFIEPANSDEDKPSGEETYDGVAGDEGDEELEEGEDDGDGDEGNTTDEPPTEPSIDFDDTEDLDALAKGILGSNTNKESVVPCFGTWWPSSGGYVYYYEDYGTGGGSRPDGNDGEDYGDGGDYSSPRRRGRRTRRRRRMRRNRTRRARTSRRTAKKKA